MWSTHLWLPCLLAHIVQCRMELTMTGFDGCTLVLPVSRDVEECGFVMEAWCDTDTYRIYDCDAYDTVQMVFPSFTGAIRPRRKTMYLFLYDDSNDKRDVKARHWPVFEDENVLAVLVDLAEMQILFNSREMKYPSGPTRFALQKKDETHESAAKMVVITGMLVLLFLICGRVVKIYECDDPRLEDFHIVSADVLPYKDVADKACKNCMICIEPFGGGDSVRMLSCSHIYHSKCIDTWLIGHLNRCPYCRKEVVVVERC